MSRPSHQVHSFGEFTLDVTRGCLLRGHEEIKLRPQSFEVLKYLIKNSGRLVAKDEVIHAIWPDTAVSDDSLVQCLKDIRHALSDVAQEIIKTVPRRGYIFNEEVVDHMSGGDVAQAEAARDVPFLRAHRETIDERSVDILEGSAGQPRLEKVKPITRLMVLPFRMLRPNADLDFLAFSVPDAVAGALSVLDSVVVVSPTASGRYGDGVLDLQRIAEDAQAQAVLTGTILSVENRIRVSCQLLDPREGIVLWWHEPQVELSNLFELQDNLVRGIVGSLSLSLSAREHQRLMHDVPTASTAYEFYLRANELSRRGLAGFSDLPLSRDLYLRSVEIDPNYSPAWAQLGRCHRLIAKGTENGGENLILAEAAFQRALKLNPDMPLAHSQYAFLEAELGHATEAVARLIGCLSTVRTSPELFVALVLCCRFCGLLDESLAAHEKARKLDPQIATSVSHTYYQMGDHYSALANIAVGAWAIEGMSLGTMGRHEEALTAFRKVEKEPIQMPMRAFIAAWRYMFEGNRKESLAAAEQCIQHYSDPEGVFYMGLIMAHLGESDRALIVLDECIAKGFASVHVLMRNPWFDDLRRLEHFKGLLERTERRYIEAQEIFRFSGGEAVLGAVAAG